MKAPVLAGLGAMLLLAGNASATTTTFDGTLTTGEVVPPDGQAAPTNPGAYEVGIVVTFDDQTNLACGRFEWTGLTGKPTALHVHLGEAGANTTTKFSIPVPAGDAVDGATPFKLQANAAFGAALAARGVYADVHTAKFPNGEVRAQLDEDDGIEPAPCPDGAAITLDGAVADAGADASTSSSAGSSSSSSSSSSSAEDDDIPSTGRTAPTSGATDATSPSKGGCNTTGTTANVSALAALGLLALKRRRYR